MDQNVLAVWPTGYGKSFIFQTYMMASEQLVCVLAENHLLRAEEKLSGEVLETVTFKPTSSHSFTRTTPTIPF